MPQPTPTEEEHGQATHLAEQIMAAIRTPPLVLGRGMRVLTANASFCRVFEVAQADVEQHCLYDLDGGLWDTPLLRSAPENVAAHDASFEDLELELDSLRIGRRPLMLMTSEDETDVILSYDLGISSFITKPVSFATLVAVMKPIGKYWSGIVSFSADQM